MKKLLFVVPLLLLFFSCEKNEDSIFSDSNSQASQTVDFKGFEMKTYSGQDYFKAIFFLNSELTTKIDVLSDYKETMFEHIESLPNAKEEFKKLNEFSEMLTKEISKNNKAFFPYFKNAMESGDPLIVRSALTMAGSEFVNAVFSSKEIAQIAIEAEEVVTALLEGDIIDANGNVDLNEVNTIISNINSNQKNGFYNSSNTLKSFGSVGKGKYGLTFIAAAVAGVTILVGLSYVAVMNAAVGINVLAGVNVAAAINVNYVVNDNDQVGGGAGSGPGSVGTACKSTYEPLNLEKYYYICPDGELNTANDLFVKNITLAFAKV